MGVKAKIVEGANSLSWSSKDMSVKIGSDRDPIESFEDMFKKIVHEFGVHGQRAINALVTENVFWLQGCVTI